MASAVYFIELAIELGVFGWGAIYGFSWTWLIFGISCGVTILIIKNQLHAWGSISTEFIKIFFLVATLCVWYFALEASSAWTLCVAYLIIRGYFTIDYMWPEVKYKIKEKKNVAIRIEVAIRSEKQILDGTLTKLLGGEAFLVLPRHKKYSRYLALREAWAIYICSIPNGPPDFCAELKDNASHNYDLLCNKYQKGKSGLEYILSHHFWPCKQALSLNIQKYDDYSQAQRASLSNDASLVELYTLAYAFESEEKAYRLATPEQYARDEVQIKAFKSGLVDTKFFHFSPTFAPDQQNNSSITKEKNHKSFSVMDMAIFYNVGKQVGKSGEASLGVVDGWMLREMRNQISQMSPDDQQHAQNTFLAGLAEASGNNKLKQAVMFDSVFKSIFG